MKNNNIQEDEIQILGSTSNNNPKKSKTPIIIGIIVLLTVVLTLVGIFLFKDSNHNIGEDNNHTTTISQNNDTESSSYIEIKEETINDVPLFIYTPHNAKVELMMGTPNENDSTIIFATKASDVDAKGRYIIGDFVVAGEHISKEKNKEGFCSIINNEISIGVGTGESLLDKAIAENGCFFRQYPLVSNNEMIENKPKGKSIRRALAKMNDKIIIVESRSRESFYDFAQALADIGVSDAIYLVGGNDVYGWYQDQYDKRSTFGTKEDTPFNATNYIIFSKQNPL